MLTRNRLEIATASSFKSITVIVFTQIFVGDCGAIAHNHLEIMHRRAKTNFVYSHCFLGNNLVKRYIFALPITAKRSLYRISVSGGPEFN